MRDTPAGVTLVVVGETTQTTFWSSSEALKTPKSEAVIGLVRPNTDAWGQKNLSCIRGFKTLVFVDATAELTTEN